MAFRKARRRASKNEIAERVAAVDVADSGASYNPSALEHSKLLKAAIDVEVA